MQVNDLRFFERESFASATVSKIRNPAVYAEASIALKKTVETIKLQRAQVAEVNADTSLSDTGKAEQIGRVEAVAADAIISADRFLKSADACVADLEKGMVFPPPENEVLHYLQLAEVRTVLNQKTPQEIYLAYERAMRTGDYNLTIAALESSPLPYGFVTEETRAVNHRNRLLKAFPDELAEITQLQEATTAVRRLGELL